MKFLNSLKNAIRSLKQTCKQKIRNTIKSVKIRYMRSEAMQRFVTFSGYVLEYGILINLILYGVFNFSVSIQSIIGWGILWYFIKYETKDIIDVIKGRSE